MVNDKKKFILVNKKWADDTISPIRLYNAFETSIFEGFYSEMSEIFLILQDMSYSAYVINYDSLKTAQLSKQDFYYLDNYQTPIIDNDINYKFSDAMQFIKKNQVLDLLYFEQLENLHLLIFIPRLTADNYFYYKLVLLFKGEHDLNPILSYNSKLVQLNNILPLININHDWVFWADLFKLESTLFKEISTRKCEWNLITLLQEN